MKLFKRSGMLVTVIGLVLLGAGVSTASATQGDPEHKDYVCKYVGKPGVDERLQTGKNPIWVDTAATDVGWFADGQARSFVIVFNTVKLDPEPGIEKCPSGDTQHAPLVSTRIVVTTTCDKSTSTLETTTTPYVLKDGVWSLGAAVITLGAPFVTTPPTAAQINDVTGLDCTVPVPVVVSPPEQSPVVVSPPKKSPVVVSPPEQSPVVGSPPEDSVEVLGVTATAPAKAAVKVLAATATAANPLPSAAAAGEADTSGQLALGGLAGLGALLAFGSAFVLRRRHGVI